MMTNASYGDNTHIAEINRDTEDMGLFTVWKNLAARNKKFGNGIVGKRTIVLVEQRLDFSCYVPEGFGTGDCLIVADKLLHIVDFKYGQGIVVESENNPQMMLYALGALRLFDHLYDIDTVSITSLETDKNARPSQPGKTLCRYNI